MDGVIDKLIGNYTRNNKRRVKKIVEAIKEKSSEYLEKSDSFFARKTEELKRRLQNGESKESVIVDALALCYAAIHKIKGYKPYDVQLEAAVAMQGAHYQGHVVAEMKTGEGKTLVQILTAYFDALDGKSVHIVSANDYLAGRDFEGNRPVFELLGLSVGLVQAKTPAEEKRESYSKDITFSTIKNIAFDYLRDNTAKKKSDQVINRPFGHIVIDEVDSTLIDEATTPIILSPSENSPYKIGTDRKAYMDRVKFLYSLNEDNIGIAPNPITFKDATNYFKSHPKMVFIYCEWDKSVYICDEYNGDKVLRNVIIARYFFKNGVNYELCNKLDEKGKVVFDENGRPVKKINIIDGPTGRISASKKFSNGVHQAIEAIEAYKAQIAHKEYSVETSDELVPLGVCTYADVLGMYEGNVSGMTGTSSEIFEDIYGMPTYQVPTRKKNIRKDDTKYYLTKKEKYEAILDDIEECYRIGRPVLIGTTSVTESEEISMLLAKRGIIHNLLNAKSESIEAAIVANAGQFGSVTVATNMAGRGTDIELGDGVRALGGLRVIGVSRNRSSRIDNQLRGRCSRQGDPGSSIMYSSLQDERVTKNVGKLDTLISNKLKARAYIESKLGHPIKDKSIKSDFVDEAQKSDEITTVEMIKHVNAFNNPLVKQRKDVYRFRNKIFDSKNIVELIKDILRETLNNTEDVSRLIELFGGYIKIDASQSIDEIKNHIYNEISRKVDSFASNSLYHDVMRRTMIKIIDADWIEQMQILEDGKIEWMTEALDGKDPLLHYELRAYDAFLYMVNCVYEEILAYAYDPNMKYGTYVLGRNRNNKSQSEDAPTL